MKDKFDPRFDEVEISEDVECLEGAEELCAPFYSAIPEIGIGVLPPMNKIEAGFNRFASKLPLVSALLILLVATLITIDVIGRLFFNTPWRGITELEMLLLPAVGFFALAYPIIQRQSMQIDIFYGMFSSEVQRILYLFSCCIGTGISFVVGWRAIVAAMEWTKQTQTLQMHEWPFVLITGLGLIVAGIAFLFQLIHILRSMIQRKEWLGILIGIALTLLLIILPFLYKASGIRLSGLAIGGLGFLVLMIILLVRVPLGFAMGTIGLLGLFMMVRRPEAALVTVGSIPFTYTATFMMVAFPMFLLMGEMVTLAGLSDDLFDAAKKWMGRLPGGLAIATVGGCAGFGAVCGDSMATVMTMSSVAMPAMRENNYSPELSCGALAAGGTLGILIPPSMGFIVFSMITEESVGKLFVAGIMPGLLLAAIFMGIIVIKVLRDPTLAPKSNAYPLSEKLISLVKLIPVASLFLVVVFGILWGWFTPAEGGAVGAMIAILFALVRGRLNVKNFTKAMVASATMFGKLFALFVGVYILQSFLSASRLPNLLSDTVAGMEMNRYWVLMAVIMLYIVLGCVMNIIPMMMLTLPTIYPTVMALGFDSVWFGVLCVIIMEMGLITPPVGMNVFTLAGLHTDIPMSTMFKGVMPFFFGMLLCAALLIIFPQIALMLL